MEKYYKVNESELIDLLTSRVELETLNAGGVDSWVWYAQDSMRFIRNMAPIVRILRIVKRSCARTASIGL